MAYMERLGMSITSSVLLLVAMASNLIALASTGRILLASSQTRSRLGRGPLGGHFKLHKSGVRRFSSNLFYTTWLGTKAYVVA